MPYTLGLLGSMPRLDRRTQEKLTPIPGSPPSLISLPPGCPFAPRCPMATAVCEDTEPSLQAAGQDHSAACHYHSNLVGATPDQVFRPVSGDAHIPAEFGAESGDGVTDAVPAGAVVAAEAAVEVAVVEVAVTADAAGEEKAPEGGTDEGEQA
jgi:oligopeptide/dipeptide ABC transporter ATP-binding protein